MPTNICHLTIACYFILLAAACSHQNTRLYAEEQAAFTAITKYAETTYGTELSLKPTQIEQLTWVQVNPCTTPEMATRPAPSSIHIEVKRALTRVYCLQLLKTDPENSYNRFIAAQSSDHKQPLLSLESFDNLSSLIRQLNEASYEALKAAAIISGVTLSPAAKQRANKILNTPLPSDSNQFLAVTAPHAEEIYPLAQAVIKEYPAARELFQTLFMPNSQLRHMMYNEGSLSMYSHIIEGIADKTINQQTLDLWYAYWIVNIAGFRGHINPNGSLYLNQNTYKAMNELKSIFNRLLQDESINPMSLYLEKRADWLGVKSLTQDIQMQTALGSLGACLRLFTVEEGKALFEGVSSLDKTVYKQWLNYTQLQLEKQSYPAETYVPAVFANIQEKVNLKDSITIVIPLYVSVLKAEREMREAQPLLLKSSTPVSFTNLATKDSIDMLIESQFNTYPININPINGIADVVKD